MERGSVTKSRKGEKAHVERKVGVFSVEGTRPMFKKETHAVSVMTQRPLATAAVIRDQEDDRLLPHPIRRPRLTKVEKKSQQHQAIKRTALQKKERQQK